MGARFASIDAMHMHGARRVVVVVVVVVLGIALGTSACSDGEQAMPNAHDAGHLDAAVGGDARVLDASEQPHDAGGPGDAATPSDAAVPMDSAVAPDAMVEKDASTRHDAGHDSGNPPVDEEDSGAPDAGPPAPEDTFSMRVVATGLESPWEITWGPDDRLWITERDGWRVIRMDPTTGSQSVAFSVPDVYSTSGQDGVLGMALHPSLGKSLGSDFVYLAYTYDADPGSDVDRRLKIIRLAYDLLLGTLGSPRTLIEGLPASTDHNSGRLVFGPDSFLYYTIGDQGHNQFDNMCLSNRAQHLPSQNAVDQEDWSTYQGKILRIGLDGSIPTDNPIVAGVRSHIYSYGHRNAQGLVFGPTGKLYASEQGPKTDDELNLILAGKNYGWPHIAGDRDDRAYVYGNWSASSPESCESLAYSDYWIPDSVPKQLETAWSNPDYIAPLRTFYSVDDSYDFMDPACPGNFYICWPTIAPASLDLYIPGEVGLKTWGTTLLLPSLKRGSVLRVPLSPNGEATQGEAKELFRTTNRYRDLAIAPNKRTFYIVTDSYGTTSGPTSGSTQVLEHRGAVLEFTYVRLP
jgi:PQQ-dependent dehydrogenase (s-GDH family)